MAEYEPPTENLPIFDSSVFNDPASTAGLTPAQAAALYLKRTGIATSTATSTTFSGGTVQFGSALIVSNGNQNTSLGNGFLPLASGQGTQNVFVGVGAGASALCGGDNTVMGYFAASQGMTSSSSYNTLYGARAGQYLTSGVGNTCIGATNCNNNTTGNSNICLGYGAMAGESSGSLSNNIVIGNGITSGASNRIIIGDGTQTSMDLNVVSGSIVNMDGKLYMTGTSDVHRLVNSCYYQIADNTSPFTTDKQIYSNGTNMVFDNDTNGGGYTFATDDSGGAQSLPLSITSASITSQCPQPAAGNSSTIVPTTAWVQSAIALAVPGGGFTSGMMMPYAGVTAPAGFLMCDGSAVSTTTYAALFAIVGTTYANFVIPPVGTFFLPDFRDRCPIGSNTVSPMSGNLVNGGLSNVVYNYNIYNGNKLITNNQVAPHTHNLTWNTANYVNSTNNTNNTSTGGSSTRLVSDNVSAFPTTTSGMSNFFNFQSQGQYLPPVCSVNYIIKT